MSRKFSAVLALLAILVTAAACGSLNRVTPSGMDDAAMEADVRGKIAEDIPDQTFSIGVSVNDGVVTLTGSVPSASDRQRIGAAAASVDGVRRVINNISIG
ncbi:MAG TPA: BON domain-containing protein [Thermoanaerobaculia bacterium]|nr:BON domain-containing protein [Thermoanaerobaculia bacterium]